MLVAFFLVLRLISATTTHSQHPHARQQLVDFFACFDKSRPVNQRFVEECHTKCTHLADTLGIDLVTTKVHSTNLVFHMARTLGNICKHFQFRESLPPTHESFGVLRTQICELWSIVSKLRQLIN